MGNMKSSKIDEPGIGTEARTRRLPSFEILGKTTGASDASQQRTLHPNDVTRILYHLHSLILTVGHPPAMTDRAAKRLRRLSTEYEDSEDNVEWNNSRYVADIPSTARSFALPSRQGPCSEHKGATS